MTLVTGPLTPAAAGEVWWSRDGHHAEPLLARPGGPPTVRLCAAPDAAPVAAAIRDALGLLVAAGRLRWAEPAGAADVLHTVGTAGSAADRAGHRVHTVHRIPLRSGPKLAAARRWVLQERHRHARGTVWLTHGRTAARMVVEAGLAPGERVRSLPVLSPWRLDPAAEQGTRDPARRVALRRELGVRPGVRLVIGVTGQPCADDVACWPAAVRRLQRTDVAVLDAAREGTDVPMPVLLAAADLVVATGGELTAASAAVPALAAGVPVVAVTTDPAAELVEAGRTGVVVSPRLDAVVDAIVAHLDRRPASGRRPQDQTARPARHELARCLLPAYGEALTWSLPRGRVR